MKTNPIKSLITGTLLASAFLFPQSATAAADTIVSWGLSPNYVGGHTNGVGLASGAVTFSDTVARSPGLPYPNGEASGLFYGGAISTNASGITVWRISNGASGANDSITFAGPLSAGEQSTALYLWKKDDFLASYDIRAANITSFSATLQHTGSGSLMTGSARWVVQVGGAYYVSAAFATTTASTQYTLSDPSSVSWFSLNPSVSLSAIGAQWDSPDFSNVSGVGLWYQLSASGTVATAAGSISQFEVTAIPEPSSAALLLGGLAAGTVLVARSRR